MSSNGRYGLDTGKHMHVMPESYYQRKPKKKIDFDPVIVKKQSECFACKINLTNMDPKEIVYHYSTHKEISKWKSLLLCDSCGLPFDSVRVMRQHKYDAHSH